MKRIGEILSRLLFGATTLCHKNIAILMTVYVRLLEVDRTTAVRVRIDIGPEDRKKLTRSQPLIVKYRTKMLCVQLNAPL